MEFGNRRPPTARARRERSGRSCGARRFTRSRRASARPNRWSQVGRRHGSIRRRRRPARLDRRCRGRRNRASAATSSGRGAPGRAGGQDRSSRWAIGWSRSAKSIQQAWRQEVTAALDQALAETSRLAERQLSHVQQSLESGDQPSSAVRAEQGSIEEGVQRLIEQMRKASGKNALVPPGIGVGARRRPGADAADARRDLQRQPEHPRRRRPGRRGRGRAQRGRLPTAPGAGRRVVVGVGIGTRGGDRADESARPAAGRTRTESGRTASDGRQRRDPGAAPPPRRPAAGACRGMQKLRGAG